MGALCQVVLLVIKSIGEKVIFMNAFSFFSFLSSIDAYVRTGGWSCARVDLSTCVALAQLIKPSVTL